MAKKETSWAAIARGLRAGGLLLANLLIGGGLGWLVQIHYAFAWRPWPVLAGLITGLILATFQLIHLPG